MAIKKQVITPHGFTVDDAYHRVDGATIIGKDKMNFSVKVYKDIDKESFASSSFVCAYDLNGGNPLQQAYAHLKTLEEFKDSKDC
jgi:hypothetical protein